MNIRVPSGALSKDSAVHNYPRVLRALDGSFVIKMQLLFSLTLWNRRASLKVPYLVSIREASERGDYKKVLPRRRTTSLHLPDSPDLARQPDIQPICQSRNAICRMLNQVYSVPSSELTAFASMPEFCPHATETQTPVSQLLLPWLQRKRCPPLLQTQLPSQSKALPDQQVKVNFHLLTFAAAP
jgi:hypothetical protein